METQIFAESLKHRFEKFIRTLDGFESIPDAMGVLVVLNERATVLNPDMIRYGLARALCRFNPDGSFRYVQNTGVIVLTELHSFAGPDGLRVMPMLKFAAPDALLAQRFSEFGDHLTDRWAAFNGVPVVQASYAEMFKAR